jgi:hypothetical protein
MGCAALALFIYSYRMTIIAIQYYDYSETSFLLLKSSADAKEKSA